MNSEKTTESFFNRLEIALGASGRQSREVIGEVRSDFAAQVETRRGEGMAEVEAVEKVLEGMGEPELLAAQMKAVLPPLSSGWVRVLRMVLGGGLIVWTLFLLWTIRAWDYGWSFKPALIFALHLPVILVLCPGIIWRRNWLFGLLPAGALVFIALVLNTAGTQSIQLIALDAGGQVASAPVVEESIAEDLGWRAGLLIGSLLVLLVMLAGAMQQMRQRRLVLCSLLLPILAVEGLFQREERMFRDQLDQLVRLVEAEGADVPEAGTLAEAGVTGADRAGARYQLSEDGRSFTMWWSRPLSPGFAIGYSSEDGRVWILD